MAAATTIKLIAASLFGHQMARDYNENHDHLASKKKKKRVCCRRIEDLRVIFMGGGERKGGGRRWSGGFMVRSPRLPCPA